MRGHSYQAGYGYRPRVHLPGKAWNGTRCGGGGRGMSKHAVKTSRSLASVTCIRCQVLRLYDSGARASGAPGGEDV